MYRNRLLPAIIVSTGLVIHPLDASSAGIEDGPSPKEPPDTGSSLIMLTSLDETASKQDAQLVADGVGERIADLGFSVQLVWLEGFGNDVDGQGARARRARELAGARGCFWLTSRETGKDLHLVVFDGGTEWAATRQLEGQGAVAYIETISVIVRSTISVLLSDQKERTSKVEENTTLPLETKRAAVDEEPPSQQPSNPSSGASTSVELGAGYDITLTSEEGAPAQGLLFNVSIGLAAKVAVFVGYVATFPLKYKSGDYSLELTHHPVQLGCRLILGWQRINIAGSLALGINYVTHEQQTSTEELELEERSGYLQFSLVPELRFGIWIIKPLGFFIAAGADFLFARPRYKIERSGVKEVILDPWPVAPRFSTGLKLLFGGREK